MALGRDKDGATVPLSPAQVIENINKLVLNEMETEHYFTFNKLVEASDFSRKRILACAEGALKH